MKWLHILQIVGPLVAQLAGVPPSLVVPVVQGVGAAEELFGAGQGNDKLAHVQDVVAAGVAVNNAIPGAPQLDAQAVNAAVAAVVPAVVSTVNAIHAAQGGK
jgi:hypothetical protein